MITRQAEERPLRIAPDRGRRQGQRLHQASLHVQGRRDEKNDYVEPEPVKRKSHKSPDDQTKSFVTDFKSLFPGQRKKKSIRENDARQDHKEQDQRGEGDAHSFPLKPRLSSRQ
ncbi:MAG: hypothetical protein OK454_09075, partial [Thaumarchaeota archaeon]|nr:hypothetical protein [Nitrososphaerota archaeon]